MFKETMRKLLSFALVLLMVGASIVAFVPTVEASAFSSSELTKLVSLDVKPYFQTEPNSCSGAASMMILQYFNAADGLNDIKLRDETNKTVYRISNALNKYMNNKDYSYKYVHKSELGTYLKNALVAGNPVIVRIAPVKKYFNYKSSGHYSVVTGIYYDKNNQMWLEMTDSYVNNFAANEYSNPTTGKVYIPLSELREYGYYEGKHDDNIYIIYSNVQRCDCRKIRDYDSLGVCNQCKKVFDHEPTRTDANGVWAITKKVSPSTTPYAAAQDKSFTFEAGAAVELLGKYTNAWDNVWYKVAYGDGKVGFVHENYLAQVATETYPSFLMVEATKDTEVMSMPCSTKTNSAAKELDILKKGDYATVYQMVKNVPGNYWYKVRTSDGVEGWIWCNETKVKYQSNEGDKVIIGNDLPTTHTYGNTRYVDFKVQTNYATIESVTGAIYNGTATSGSAVFDETLNVNSKSINLKGSKIDNEMKFAQLGAGKQYTLVISAVLTYNYYDPVAKSKAVYHYTVSKDWTFTVSGSSSGGTTQPTITPATITEDTYYFVNGEHRMYMISDTSGRSNIGASIAAFNSKYEFKVVKDGDHYDIVPVDGKNGYLLNAYWLTSSTKTCNNDEVTLYKSSQGWIFEKCGDGYLIHPRDNTSLSITREDDKLLVKTTTKADNQIWKLVSSACDHTFEYKHEEFDNLFESEGNHWLECTKCGYKTSYETHQWEFVMNTTGQFVMGNSKYHAYRCSVCGLGKYEYHEYSNECDPLCDICNSKVSEREVSHKYDNDCDSTCNVCGTTRSVTHTYSNPCDATCNNCGYVREATHSYEWVRNNETHCQECSICGAQTEPVEHEYRMIGMATDPALKDYHYYGCDICKWGVKELHVYDNDCDRDCNVCAYSGREVEHAASNEYGHDSEIHAKKCPICGGYYAQEEHKFSNDCDTTCNVCNYERSITHNYGALLLSDADGHWNACSVCGEKGNFESHNPGPEATEDSAQVCLDCGYVLEGKKNHEHIYGVYVHNEYQHWRECEADDCNARSDSAGHDFGNNCDVDCSACGFVREVQHEFTNDCDASCNVCGETRETEHTYDHGCDTACNVCGERRDTEHRYDNAEDEKCNECGFVRDVDNGGNNGGENNPGGETGEKPGNEPGAEDNTVDEPPVDEPEDNTTTVLIIAAAAIVTILGLALILRKRS